MCADIYSFSQVVAYALTGKMPWPGRNSVSVQAIRNNSIQWVDQVEIPEQLSGTCTLRDVIYKCRSNPESRPTAVELVTKSFGGKQSSSERFHGHYWYLVNFALELICDITPGYVKCLFRSYLFSMLLWSRDLVSKETMGLCSVLIHLS